MNTSKQLSEKKRNRIFHYNKIIAVAWISTSMFLGLIFAISLNTDIRKDTTVTLTLAPQYQEIPIQAPYDGILNKMNYSSNSNIDRGEILFSLGMTKDIDEYIKNRKEIKSLEAQEARLIAELNGLNDIQFPGNLDPNNDYDKSIIERENSIFRKNETAQTNNQEFKNNFLAEISIIKEKITNLIDPMEIDVISPEQGIITVDRSFAIGETISAGTTILRIRVPQDTNSVTFDGDFETIYNVGDPISFSINNGDKTIIAGKVIDINHPENDKSSEKIKTYKVQINQSDMDLISRKSNVSAAISMPKLNVVELAYKVVVQDHH